MGKHQLNPLMHDFEDSWEDVIQYSEHLEPGHFIRYTDQLGERYEIVE